MSYDDFRFRNPEDLVFAGYVQLAGPYYRKDAWMLEALTVDAQRANKTLAYAGDRTRVEVWNRSKKAD